MQSNTASTRLNSENQKPTLEKFIKKTIVATEKTRYYRRFYVGLKSNESFVDARNDLKELLKQGYASRSTSNEKWIHSRLRDYSLAEFSTDKWYPPKTEREAKEMAYAAFYEGKDVGSALVFQKKPNLTAFDSALDGFDSIGSELDAITDQDIDSDPLAVLDLCIEVLEESTDAITPTGRTNPVKTAKGTKIGTQFAVVEVEKLITSHDSAGNENPAFPQELQPRDRSRDASRAWVAKVANSLDNDSLGRTSRADSGAPIVGRDGIVESGNGRTMAIRMAYDQGTADEYRQFLIDEADYFGIDPDQVEGMERPVLVRVRTTDIDRRVFTVEANQDDKLALSATERARSDAKRLDDKLLAIFAPGEDGDLNTAANQRFIQGFLKSIGDNEAAQYMTTDGKPTKGLIDRIQAAIFSKAYNDDRLLEMMADQTKTEIKNVISALNSAAPKFIESQAYSRLGTDAVSEQVVDGIEQSLDQRVIDAVIEATNTLLAAKAKNQDITEYVTQGGLFEGIDEGVAALAVFLSQNARNPKRIGIAFKAMAEFVKTDAIDQTNVGLFGDPVPPSMVDVVAAANREIQRIYGDDDDKTIGLFDDPVEPEPVTETKIVTVKVPISVNLINEATSAAWSGLEKLNDDAFLKVWKNLKAADYMRRRSIRPTGERKSNQHILNQAASGDVQKMVDSEVAKRGFEKKYTLFIEQKDVNGFDSYLADGRYDHIHLDDLQMHPYANAAKERQPTAKTPLLVQKNRRGDLYLIAGVKRYEMALDDDLEYLPAVILPVVEGYGDPVIKRVLNAYTGSIDPLALMAAIEDAVTERAGKKAMFDGLGGDISTITDLDIQNDPLGVLEACLAALENPTGFDVNNPATILRYVNKIADQLATASDAQKAISLDYIDELRFLMSNTEYDREELRKIVRKLTETVLVEASTNTQKLLMDEYMEGGGTLVYDLELYKSTETYQRAMKESISHRNAQIYEAWDIHLTETRELWKQLNDKSIDPMTSDEQLNELKKAYDEKSMLRWEEFSAARVDAWRPEKDRIEAEMKGKGQQLINDVLSASKVSTDAATQWAAQQIITTAAEKQLVKMGYAVDQVRKDLAEFYQVTNGAISHIGIDYSGKKDRAYTINSTNKVADKWMYIGSRFDKRVLFHEAGHHIESDKAALAASTYFLKFKRGNDDKLYKLKDLMPGSEYKSSEVAYKGGFFSAYVGKYYEHGSTEVWSMGVESLYDPVVLAERAAVDPQMFAMIMGGIKLPKNPLVEVSDAIFSEQMNQQGAKKEDAEKLREDAIKKIVSLVTFDKTPVPNVEQALFDYNPKYHAGSTFHGRHNDWYVFAVQSVMNPRTNRRGKGYVCLEYKKRNEYFVPEILTVKAAGKLDADEIKLYVAALSVSEPISARRVVMGRLSDERVQEILSKLTGGSNE